MAVIERPVELAVVLRSHFIGSETMVASSARINETMIMAVTMAAGSLCTMVAFAPIIQLAQADQLLRAVLMPPLGVNPTAWRSQQTEGPGIMPAQIPKRMEELYKRADDYMRQRVEGDEPEQDRALQWAPRELAAWLERNLLRIQPYPRANGTMTRLLAAWMIIARSGNVLPDYRNWDDHRNRAQRLDSRDWGLYYSGLFLG